MEVKMVVTRVEGNRVTLGMPDPTPPEGQEAKPKDGPVSAAHAYLEITDPKEAALFVVPGEVTVTFAVAHKTTGAHR